MKHMNLQPLDSHGVDFSRVRMWNLNNWARHYRQTLVFSSIQDPQINNILTKHCANYRGQVGHTSHFTIAERERWVDVNPLSCNIFRTRLGNICRFILIWF